MCVSGLLRKVGLGVVALALASAYVSHGAGVAHADPTTVDGARAQLDQLEQQQSDLDAKYTEVQVKLQDSQKALDDARTDSAAQQAKVASLKVEVSQIALQQYRSSGLDTTTQLLVTDDVQSFLNGLSTIKKANDNTASLLQDYQSAQADLADLQKATEAQTAQIAAQEASLADLKKQSDDKVAAAQALLDKLTAAQKAAAGGRAGRREPEDRRSDRHVAQCQSGQPRLGRHRPRRQRSCDRRTELRPRPGGQVLRPWGHGPELVRLLGLTMTAYAPPASACRARRRHSSAWASR
jgi:peptidoglycan hydrolase CwlO-like protein